MRRKRNLRRRKKKRKSSPLSTSTSTSAAPVLLSTCWVLMWLSAIWRPNAKKQRHHLTMVRMVKTVVRVMTVRMVMRVMVVAMVVMMVARSLQRVMVEMTKKAMTMTPLHPECQPRAQAATTAAATATPTMVRLPTSLLLVLVVTARVGSRQHLVAMQHKALSSSLAAVMPGLLTVPHPLLASLLSLSLLQAPPISLPAMLLDLVAPAVAMQLGLDLCSLPITVHLVRLTATVAMQAGRQQLSRHSRNV
jgi:hypothetical protein